MKDLKHLRFLNTSRLLSFVHFIDTKLVGQVSVAVRRAALWIDLVQLTLRFTQELLEPTNVTLIPVRLRLFDSLHLLPFLQYTSIHR